MKKILFTLAAIALTASAAIAQTTYYWDANDSTSGFGTAQGTWADPTTNNATQGWSTSSTGVNVLTGTTSTTTLDSLNFGTAADQLGTGTITVSGDVSANTLNFVGSSSNVTLSGGNITLGGTNPGITVTNSANSTTINPTISSNVILGANQTWTVTSNGTLGRANLDVSGIVSGGFGITKAGSGNLNLSGNNSFSGGLVVNGAGDGFGVTLANNNAAGTGNITVNGAAGNLGATLSLTNGVTVSNNLSLSAGASRANLTSVTGTNTYAGNITVSGSNFVWLNRGGAGTLQVTGPITGNLTGSGGLYTHSGGGAVDISGNITLAGTSVVGMFEVGTLTLSGSNTFGSFNLRNGGTLNINNANALGTGNATFAGASIFLNNTSGAAITLAGNNAQNWNGNFTFTGTNDLNLGTGAVSMNASRTVTVSAGNLTVGGAISGATFGLTKAGAGTLILSSNGSSYNGTTTVNAGTLSVSTLADGGSNSGIGSSGNSAANLILNGGTLQYTGASANTDRLFSLQTSSTLDASGSGAVNFTNSGSMGFNGGTAAKTLTLTGNNTGANTLAAAIGNNTGATSLIKNGVGTWVLTGNNTYTGATVVNLGQLAVGGSGQLNVGNNSTMSVTGSNSTGTATLTFQDSGALSGTDYTINVGNAANARAVLNIKDSSSITLNGTGTGTNILAVGSTIASGAGAVVQSGGDVSVSNQLFVGTTGSGYYNMSGGNLNLTGATGNTSRFRVGAPVAGSLAVFQQSGGAISFDTGFGLGIVDSPVAGGPAGYGTYYMTAGTLTGNLTAGTGALSVGGRSGQGDFTLAGGTVNIGVNAVTLGGEATATGILNINGGSLQANNIAKGSGTGYLSFAGGTLVANGNTATFLQGLTRADIHGGYTSGDITYAGGATIDTNGRNVTVAQALLAPTGNGVAVGSFTPVTGLIGAPYVQVLGTGTGATAQAIFDSATGTMTGIVVTNPGVNYTGTPTFLISGGGLSANQTVNATTFANTSGGLTKTGNGTLTLGGTNTYTGNTTINTGTLLLASAGSIANSGTINVASGATFNVAAVSGGFALGSSQTLKGSGTVAGNATINGNLQPGSSPGVLNFDSNLTLASTANTTMEITGSAVRGTDFDGINVTSALTYDGTLSLAIGTTFGVGNYTFDLFNITGSPSGTFDVIALSGDYTGNLTGPGDVWSLTSGDNTWTFTHSTGDLGLSVIPEPSTWALLTVSLTALVTLRRRRRD